MITTEVRTGAAIAEVIDDLARLRIEVFRDWPYLYDGNLAYEARYLENYAKTPEAVVITAHDGGTIVGAATGCPVHAHADGVSGAYAAAGFDVDRFYYLAESVLLPHWRGQGLGHVFFDAREAQANACGASHTGFCAVIRPPDHPARPRDARELAPFWEKRGYRRVDAAPVRMSWRDTGALGETAKDLALWARAL